MLIIKSYIICVLTILFLVTTLDLKGKEQNEEIRLLIESAESLPGTNPQRSIALANKVILYAQNVEDNALLARAYLVNGIAYGNYGDFLTGFESVKSALNVCPKDAASLRARILLRLSSLYIYMRDLKMADSLANEALRMGEMLKDSLIIANSFNAKGLVDVFIPDNSAAEENFLKSLIINRAIENESGIAMNLNNLALYDNGNFQAKIEQLQEAIMINLRDGKTWSLAENYNNLGRQYYFGKDYNEALDILNIAREYAIKVNARELLQDNNRYFSDIYKALGEYEEAYQYQNQVLEEVESGKIAEQIRRYESELLQNSLDRTNKTIRENTQEYQLQIMRYTIILIIALFLLVTMLLYYFVHKQRQRRIIQLLETKNELEKQLSETAMQEKELIDLKLRQKEDEANNAAKELESIKYQLTNTAFFIRGRSEMLSNIQAKLREAYKLPDSERLDKLHSISRSITQFNSKSNEMELLVDSLNSHFVFKLSEKYPLLTSKETRLASLLRIGLSSKEIAIIIASQPKTVDMARYRLRKKMGLESEDGLQECLSRI